MPAVPATQALAEFVAASRLADIPPKVRHEGIRSILNSVGVALGGCRDEAIEIALQTLSPFFGAAQATILGRHERADALNAAFLSGAAANVLEYDDTHFPTVMHPAAPVLPGLPALAETRGASGAALLHAFILGVEVGCRIGKSVTPDHYRRGFHITATCGIFGAAAAAAKLIGLDRERTAWALGHAATQSAGLVESLGSMSKSIGVGNAARNGLAAALFAERGFTAAAQAIEGRYGFAAAASSSFAAEVVTDGLGKRWEALANCHKPYPCGVVLFPVIDACLEILRRNRPAAGRVARITVRGHPLLRERTDRPAPETGREAKVSLQHSIAVAFVQGAAGLAQYEDAAVADPAVRALRGKVSVEVDKATPVEAAAVTIEMTDGTILAEHVRDGRGTPGRPMTDAELDRKVTELVEFGAPHVDASEVIGAIRALETEPDAARIARLTVPR